MLVGISLRLTKLFICPIGASSTNKPMRFPSNPRTDMRDALPIPPVFRTVTPTVRARTSLIEEAVPCICLLVSTEIGMALSRNARALLLAVTIMPSRARTLSLSRKLALVSLFKGQCNCCFSC